MQASAWELVRQYNLGYVASCDPLLNSCLTQDYDAYAPGLPGLITYNGPIYYKLTLTGTRLVGNDGTTSLPRTSFTYGTTRGSNNYANADWNRLKTVDNGQGGTIAFAYEQIGVAVGTSGNLSYDPNVTATTFRNYRRVTTRTTTDGRGNSYPTTYAYAKPALNSLGYELTGDHNDTQALPNSAALYANKYQDTSAANVNHEDELVIGVRQEFRGHAYVRVTDPTGAQSEHWFY